MTDPLFEQTGEKLKPLVVLAVPLDTHSYAETEAFYFWAQLKHTEHCCSPPKKYSPKTSPSLSFQVTHSNLDIGATLPSLPQTKVSACYPVFG